MEKKAVIFDMDGVLVDSEPIYLHSFQDFLQAHHGNITPDTLNAIAGASAKQTWILISKMWPEPIAPEEVRKIFKKEYAHFQIPYQKILFPGIPELLSELKNMGLKIGVASSSSEEAILKMLEETSLKSYFSCFVSGKWFPESKPNPAIYQHSLKLLKLPPDACLAVEDSFYGIRAAKNAGLEVAAVQDTRFSFDQSEADFQIAKTTDLLNLLKA